jgi:hypothetical protein
MSAKKFLAWAASKEIILDDRYSSEQQMLVFKPYRMFDRFWERPAEPGGLAHFLKSVLEAIPGWETCYLWCRNGSWAPTTESEGDSVIATVYRGAGIPERWPGAIQFQRSDFSAIHAVLFVHCAFGWSVCEDVFLVPDHARLILGVDHHEVIWARFAGASDVEPFVLRMADAGYHLPTALPDETFKPQPWMTASGAQPGVAPNFGPGTPPGNSGVGEGLPSVS